MKADRRRGFILPTSLLVLTLLTVMLTAAFVLISAEYRSTDNAMAGTRALALSQAAMQTYFATNRSKKPTDTNDSVRYTYAGGYADVVARKMLLANAGQTTWVIRSTGTSTDPLLTGTVAARRTIAQLATLNPSMISPRAAMAAINGVNVSSALFSNPLDGHNTSSGVPGCVGVPIGSLADTNALLTVSGLYSTNIGPAPNGGVNFLTTAAALYDSTHVDWPSVVSGNFSPDYVGAAGLPAPGNTTWDVGFINGNVTIPASPGNLNSGTMNAARQGVLIVTGDVTLADDAHWAGLLVVGGRLIPQGDFMVEGYTITGLNCATGPCPPKNDFARFFVPFSFRQVRWSWCYATLAIQSLSAMVPVKNSFIDNWAAY